MPDLRTIEYSELRTFGQFQNERVGATAVLRPDEDADQALGALRAWVGAQLRERADSGQIRDDVHSLTLTRDRLQGEVQQLKQQATFLAALLEKHGVQVDDLCGLPF